MTAQPTGRPSRTGADRVPRTIDGIAEALQGADRMVFYREVGQADVEEQLRDVIATWWGRAMLVTDPEGPALARAVAAGTLPTVSMAEVVERRRKAGGELPAGA
jgi:hypothetical protein